MYQAAVKLNNGKVLFFGGRALLAFKPTREGATDLVEEYDPQTRKFTIIGKMLEPRSYCQAVLLDNGKIFIYGGAELNSKGQWHCELYDPITNTSKYTSKMHYLGAQQGDILTKMGDGRVFMKVGTPYSPEEDKERRDKRIYTTDPKPNRLGAIEIYDPKTDTYELQYVLHECRRVGAQLFLPDNRVLLMGGYSQPSLGDDTCSNSVEIYDSIKAKSEMVGYLSNRVNENALILIKNRYVLVINPRTGPVRKSRSVNPIVFDIQGNKEIKVGPMKVLRGEATLTQLPNGNILIAGGYYHRTGKKSQMSEIFKVDPQ